MKPFFKFIAISIWLFSLSSFAQKKVWLDSNLKKTTQNQGKYYKIVPQKESKIFYYYKSGNVFRIFYYFDGKIEGKFSEFYESGELKTIGKYENGLREGVWKTYYKNGKIKEKGKYDEGKQVGVWKVFYKRE